jgi:hypothetical protein
MSSERDERIFIVRMWRDRGRAEDGGWRGSVRDVDAAKTRYVIDAREIAEYIASALPEERRR